MRRVCVFTCWFLAGALAVLGGCASEPTLHRYDYAQVIMGVRVNIAAYCEEEVKARTAAREAFEAVSRVDAALSDYRADSEAMRLCDAAGRGPVPVSDLLADVLRRSLEISQASGGAFDVTAGPMVLAWRQARRQARLPEAAQIARAREVVGWPLVSLHTDATGSLVALAAPGVRLDFGGIGKGFGADQGLRAMRRAGVPIALVAAAGDIAAGDPPPGRAGWRIEMGTGSGPGHGQEFIEVSRCGVSTSGDTEQFIEIAGVRYSHIVDPRTGIGVTKRWLVTTVAPDAATADAAATALCVLDAPARAGFLQHFPGLEARVRLADDTGFGESVTPGFPAIGRGP